VTPGLAAVPTGAADGAAPPEARTGARAASRTPTTAALPEDRVMEDQGRGAIEEGR
jgi:hypothetical protein